MTFSYAKDAPAFMFQADMSAALEMSKARRAAHMAERAKTVVSTGTPFKYFDGNERRSKPRIIGLDGVWTMEKRLAEAAMRANHHRFTGEAISRFDELGGEAA